ncbi:MAG: hypothetical protein HY852_21280 [Bradyrhizobium sp.]|uniref:hypothetical protein n=1 Tax=Bradyrhizobium sp. TaxID=376 RepID=UPI0025C36006|nr:hypothetical protein [Bradyrhizobium sp.]MBI5264339.1 hypothetical protein [Bradyrhizobium sp.]
MTELQALLTSIAVEGVAAYGLVRATAWPCRGSGHAAVAIAIATCVTHPQAWAAAEWLYPRLGYEAAFAAIEVVVILAEAAIVHWGCGLAARRALAVSALANAASASVGLLLDG